MSSMSCIRDIPIKKDGDLLNATKYAGALAKFIRHADTPVTIGIQGGWGSGKTSLFTLIQYILEKDENNDAIFININAWEHSLFQEKSSKSLVVLSILTAITEQIKKEVENNHRLDRSSIEIIINKLSPLIQNGLHTIGRYMPSLVGAAIGAFTGATPQMTGKAEMDAGKMQLPRLAEQIARLRDNLQDLARNIKRDGKPVKTVIFIDDLDRVSPVTAVSILDVIKNIFDLENCVFVLAIDYEVVVKGLEEKFGQRTDANEREFRQYFDKIIQVPFTMPVGAYSNEMKALLKQVFGELEIYEEYDIKDETYDVLTAISKLATGGNPRTIKRLLNTLSLLQYIPFDEEKNLDSDQKEKYLIARFIITALHLNFPEISKRVMENNKFSSWKISELDTPWELNYNGHEKDLKALAENPEMSAYFDEDWEQIVFCLCAKNEWLKRKAWNVSRMLNILRKNLNELDPENKDASETDDPPLSDAAMECLSHILATINVVSIDSEQSNPAERLKYDSVSKTMKQLHAALLEKLPKGLLAPPDDSIFAQQDEIAADKRAYHIETKKRPFTSLRLEYQPAQEDFTVVFTGVHSTNATKKQYDKQLEDLEEHLPAPWYIDSEHFSSDKEKPFFRVGLTNNDVPEKEFTNSATLSAQIFDLYKLAEQLAKNLN